jgi:surface protein
MNGMFFDSYFTKDISNWDVSKVKDMAVMFYNAKYNQDLNNWKPLSLVEVDRTFEDYSGPIPYWANFNDNQSIKKAVEKYWLQKELDSALPSNNNSSKKIKV